MNGIQLYLTYEQRCELIEDIYKVYGYSSAYKKKLHKRSDNQLLAFRESMRERGLLSGYVKGPSIHMKVFMNELGANTYIVSSSYENIFQTKFYIGLDNNEKDRFGLPKKYQLGVIIIDENWIIKYAEIYGESLKRYNGLRLIIDGSK